MILRRKKEPVPTLRFDMKLVCTYGQGVTHFTYSTVMPSADKALAAIYAEIGGEKVVCISSSKEGKSIIFPRENLVYVECTFIEEEK